MYHLVHTANEGCMNLLFHSTEAFEQDLQQFDACLQERIAQRVNEVAQAFIEDRQVFAQQARKPYTLHLSNAFDSSLYSVIVEPDLRVILTVDDDPLFDQVIVTLMRVVKRPDLYNAYTSAAKTLYQNLNERAAPGIYAFAKTSCHHCRSGTETLFFGKRSCPPQHRKNLRSI
jgi:hypothetical protein